MNTHARERTATFATSGWTKRLLVAASILGLASMAYPQTASAFQDSPGPQQDAQQPDAPQPAQNGAPAAPSYTPQTPEQLQQLVAPIALYPDSLVAQILAASTFPGANRRSRSLGPGPSRPERRRAGASSRSTELGSQRESPHRLSHRPRQYGQESFLDLFARRRLLQPATGRDGRGSGNATESATNRQPQIHAATNCRTAGPQHRHPTCRSANRLRPGIRSVARLRLSDHSVALLVPISRDLVSAVRVFTSASVWYRLLRRLWLGLAQTGAPTGAATTSSTITTPTTRTATPFITATLLPQRRLHGVNWKRKSQPGAGTRR